MALLFRKRLLRIASDVNTCLSHGYLPFSSVISVWNTFHLSRLDFATPLLGANITSLLPVSMHRLVLLFLLLPPVEYVRAKLASPFPSTGTYTAGLFTVAHSVYCVHTKHTSVVRLQLLTLPSTESDSRATSPIHFALASASPADGVMYLPPRAVDDQSLSV